MSFCYASEIVFYLLHLITPVLDINDKNACIHRHTFFFFKPLHSAWLVYARFYEVGMTTNPAMSFHTLIILLGSQLGEHLP